MHKTYITRISLISKNINLENLIQLLKNPYKKKWFCFHNWIYWKLYGARRMHRVCTKCYKKQSKIYADYPTFWIKDKIIKL